MALRLQQVLVDAPISNLARGESIRSFVDNLSRRFDVTSSDLQQQFHDILSRVFASALGFWICDYVAIVCADAAICSSDPEEHTLLQPTGVLSWCHSTAQELQNKVVTLVKSGAATGAQPDHIIELGHATKTLLAITEAVRAASGSSSPAVDDLISTLQLLQQTTQVLQWLEQLQQQRPGMQPLITRSMSSRALSGGLAGFPGLNPTPAPIEPFGPRTAPAHVSVTAWQQRLTHQRKSAPNGRLFLDDLVDRLLKVSEGQRAVQYPYVDVLACVEGLFLSGSSSIEAWRAKLAVLLYYLLDGGWLTSAAPFAQGFQLPLTQVQQWQCHYLMDIATVNSSSSGSGTAAAGGSSKLEEACKLLGAIASPVTPFRFVEALLAAGRPTTALAVQHARCAASSGGSASAAAVSLPEALVLLKVQLGCGLLAEAFSELRRHCNQLPQSQRLAHVKALIEHLAAWASETAQLQQPVGTSRLQQLCQLPFNAHEESALLGYFRQRMAEGDPVSHIVPLYLLQRGRSLEALQAYTEYQASPAAAVAADSDNGALIQRQLQTLMSAAAAALPPSLRATAAAAAAGSSVTAILPGLGAPEADLSRSAIPVAVLQQQGVEQPAFMSQLVPAAVAGDAGIRTARMLGPQPADVSAAAAAMEEQPSAVGAASAPDSTFLRGFTSSSAAAAADKQFTGSLFGAEIAAEAGPGAVPIGQHHTALAGTSAAAADAASGDFVPLLFGTPAPGAAPGSKLGFSTPGDVDSSGFSTPGAGKGLGFGMSEEEFSREVLGIQGSKTADRAGEGSRLTRSIKRQKQTPVGYRPGAR